jgi:acyl-CoA hydrolase
MFDDVDSGWEKRLVSPDVSLSRIEPGMSIFLGTGVAEPRTLVKHLTTSEMGNLTDLELIQIGSLGDAISFKNTAHDHRYRLKTFFAGWLASEAITSGSVDMIPCRFSGSPIWSNRGPSAWMWPSSRSPPRTGPVMPASAFPSTWPSTRWRRPPS